LREPDDGILGFYGADNIGETLAWSLLVMCLLVHEWALLTFVLQVNHAKDSSACRSLQFRLLGLDLKDRCVLVEDVVVQEGGDQRHCDLGDGENVVLGESHALSFPLRSPRPGVKSFQAVGGFSIKRAHCAANISNTGDDFVRCNFYNPVEFLEAPSLLFGLE
jgi:hypothetical protein